MRLSRPLRVVGVAPERLALRLLLVLRYVEASPRGQGPGWTGGTGWPTSPANGATAEMAPVVLARERLGLGEGLCAGALFAGLLWWSLA